MHREVSWAKDLSAPLYRNQHYMKMLFIKILNTAVFLQGVKFLPYQIQKVIIKVEVINISTV
jgi:hypothetical protein